MIQMTLSTTGNNIRRTSKLIVGIIVLFQLVLPSFGYSQSSNTLPAKKKVWIDTDLAVGMKRHNRPGFSDVDDGYAVLQLMKSCLLYTSPSPRDGLLSR